MAEAKGILFTESGVRLDLTQREAEDLNLLLGNLEDYLHDNEITEELMNINIALGRALLRIAK